jgi:protein SCO1/2
MVSVRRLLDRLALAALAAVTAGAALAHEQAADFDEDSALEYSQAAIGRTLGDFTLRDRSARPIDLAAYRGRPVLVSFIYTSCYHTCPLLTRNLAEAVSVAAEALGADSFQVLTIGFDTRVDTPTRMRAFAREHDIDEANWAFLSADHETIDALAENLGFIYFPSPKGFDHLSQTTVIDGDGRIRRQIYGESFEAPLLVEPLKELVFGGANAKLTSFDGLVNRVRLICTIYDPNSERYRFDYSIFIGMIIGFVILASVAFFLVRAWWRGRPQAHVRPG